MLESADNSSSEALRPAGFKKYQIAIYIITLLLCFMFFQQGDLFHTIVSAESYLNGHFLDFYNYNRTILGGNDYFPTLYIIFSVWLLPLKIISLLTHATTLSDLSHWPTALMFNDWMYLTIAWSKLLLVASFVSTALIVYKIGKIVTDGGIKTSKYTAAIFATSPIAVFAVFIFGQYDVIGLLIAMIGFYYYLQKNLLKFSLLFSVAISCKLFPIVMFIPLLLLSEKKPGQLLKYSAIAALLPLLDIALYWHNEAFRSVTLFGGVAAGRLHALSELALSVQLHTPYLVILYLIICLYAYIKEPTNEFERKKLSVFLPIGSYAVFFSTISWNPQWLIFITPFFALSTLYCMQKEKLYLIELLGVCAYFLIIVTTWPQNVDAIMLQHALLRGLFPLKPLILANMLAHSSIIQHAMNGVFIIYLFSPILIFVFQKGNAIVTASIKTQHHYFNSRFVLGLAFFLVPMFFCGLAPIWLPSNIIEKIDHNYYAVPEN